MTVALIAALIAIPRPRTAVVAPLAIMLSLPSAPVCIKVADVEP